MTDIGESDELVRHLPLPLRESLPAGRQGKGEGASPVHPHLSPPPSRGRIVGKIFMVRG